MAQRKAWDDLKLEFLAGPWIKVADFLRDKGIRDSGNTRGHTKGWADERRSLKNEIEQATTDAIKRKTIETHTSILTRHRKIWKAVEIMALRHLEAARKAGDALDAATLKKLAETLKIATEGERLANGMSTAKIENDSTSSSLEKIVAQMQQDRGLTTPIDATFEDALALPSPTPATSADDAGSTADA